MRESSYNLWNPTIHTIIFNCSSQRRPSYANVRSACVSSNVFGWYGILYGEPHFMCCLSANISRVVFSWLSRSLSLPHSHFLFLFHFHTVSDYICLFVTPVSCTFKCTNVDRLKGVCCSQVFQGLTHTHRSTQIDHWILRYGRISSCKM